MASMDFNVGGEEKDDDDINDPEIEMNIGARGTRLVTSAAAAALL